MQGMTTGAGPKAPTNSVSTSGRWLGRYELLHEIATGGMATVYLGRARGVAGFERVVAIKCCHPHLRGDEEFATMFLDEARLAARIHHPNAVSTLDVGDEEALYLVMEYIEGDRLSGLIKAAAKSGDRIPLPVALRIGLDTLAGLHAAHELCDDDGQLFGLVHRDVSPHNVLVSRAGEVKLGDFGIAKATLHREDTQSGVRKGKYGYMSPEQVQAAPLSAASDRFALGVTLCELLTGARPFDGDGPLDTMERIRDAAPPALPGLAPDLRALVHGCLAQSPAARPTADALCDALAQALAARPPVDARHLGAWVAAHTAAAL